MCISPFAQSQTTTGKKASLNTDGKIKIESIVLTESSLNRSSNNEMLPGFPFGSQANPSFKNFRGAAIADLDADGSQEIIFGAYSKLFAIKGNGEILWSRNLSGTIIYPPAVADMDNDGDLEIVLNTGGVPNAGRVYLMDHQGNDIDGWPLNFDDHWMFNSPSISDVDGDGIMEIVTCERGTSSSGFLHLMKIDGTTFNENWPLELPGNLAFTPSIGDVNNDGNKNIVISISSGSLYALNLNGEPINGFPLTETNNGFSYQSPILVDLNGDKKLEIVGARHGDSPDYYVVKSDGTYMNGWPVQSEGWRYSPPTVVDADSDGEYEIYVGHPNTDNGGFPMDVIHGFNAQAEVLPHFPINKNGGCEGVISVADVNNDGVQDLVFTSNITDADGIGFIHAYSLDGSGEIDGFPLRPKGFTFVNSAVLGDINNDGLLDLSCLSYTQFTGNDSIFISAYNLDVPYDETKILANGYKGNNLRDGLVDRIYAGTNQNNLDQINFKVTPNPACSKLVITLGDLTKGTDLILYNTNGQAVKQIQLQNIKREYGLNISDLPTALYVIAIVDNGKIMNEEKVMIQH
jgi:hypothetical protein